MAFTDAQKVDIRRHCGFPVYGSQVGSNAGYRYFQSYGTLEFRMSNLTAAEEAVVVTYLTSLTTLEAAIAASGANLDTDVAAVWTHNKNEVRDRDRLYKLTCRRLCGALGVPPGPNLGDGTTRLVV